MNIGKCQHCAKENSPLKELRKNCKCAVPSMGHICELLLVFFSCSAYCSQKIRRERLEPKTGSDAMTFLSFNS